jgi:hypothetical protein
VTLLPILMSRSSTRAVSTSMAPLSSPTYSTRTTARLLLASTLLQMLRLSFELSSRPSRMIWSPRSWRFSPSLTTLALATASRTWLK